MKNYKEPEIEMITLSANDFIVTSPGTETPAVGDNDGIWDLDISD